MARANPEKAPLAKPLTEPAAETLFGALIDGRLDDAGIEDLLRALPVRAETATEKRFHAIDVE